MKITHIELTLALLSVGILVFITISFGSNGGKAPVADARVSYLQTSVVQKFVSIEAGKDVYFDGSNSFDPDGGIAEYPWNFGDGVSDTGVTVNHAYTTEGVYYANLTVIDDDNNPSIIPSTVKVIVNPGLMAEIQSPEDSSGILNVTGNIIKFKGRAIGGTPRYSYPHYDYRWESDRDGIIGDTAEFEIDVTSLSVGDHQITLNITDALGDNATETIQITIITELKAKIVNVERFNCSTLKTFSDGTYEKRLTFPAGGGSNSEAKVTLPLDARVCEARFDVESEGCVPRPGGDILIYDFGVGFSRDKLITLLEGEGYTVNHHTRDGEDIDNDLIQRYGQVWFFDTLTPGRVITDQEINVIENYVNNGNNILLSADNSAGWNENAGPIAERFNVHMGGSLGTGATSPDWCAPVDDPISHDIMIGVNQLTSSNSDAIITDIGGSPEMICMYHEPTVPPNSPCAAALTSGGRIVFDSSLFRFADDSAFGNIEDCENSDYAKNIAEWLEGTPTMPPVICEGGDLELVFVIDTSGSMGGAWTILCGIIDQIIIDAQSRGADIKKRIYALEHGVGKCEEEIIDEANLEDSIIAMNQGLDWDDVAAHCSGSRSCTRSQAWTVGTYWAANNHPWEGGRKRVILPISDDIATDDPQKAVDIAADACISNDVTVYGLWVEPKANPNIDALMWSISTQTGGEATLLTEAQDLVDVIAGIIVVPEADTSLDIGSDGVTEWSEPAFSGEIRISDENTQPQLTAKLNGILGGNCNCPGCSLVGQRCTIDLNFTTNPDMPLTLNDLHILYCYGSCPDCMINWTGQASGGRHPYKVKWISTDDGVIDRYWIEDNPGNYTLFTTPPMVPPISEGYHNIIFEVEDSLGNIASDIEYEVPVYWCCAYTARCTTYWPRHEGPEIDTGNEISHSCDIYEVCHPDLWQIVREARECCKSNCRGDCHGRCGDAYVEGELIGLIDGAINSTALDGLKKCEGLYLIYGFGPTARFMSDYFWPEICCLGDAYCLTGCCPQDLDLCRCCYHVYNRNALSLPCTGEVAVSPIGWRSDAAMNKNSCFFSDLPAHTSILGDEGIVTEAQGINTGTCCDYSNALTTALRIVGYDFGEVYSTTGPGHCYNLVKFPQDNGFHIIDTTGNKDVPWRGYDVPPSGPPLYPYCDYSKINPNCRNDQGIFDCPPEADVYGCP